MTSMFFSGVLLPVLHRLIREGSTDKAFASRLLVTPWVLIKAFSFS